MKTCGFAGDVGAEVPRIRLGKGLSRRRREVTASAGFRGSGGLDGVRPCVRRWAGTSATTSMCCSMETAMDSTDGLPVRRSGTGSGTRTVSPRYVEKDLVPKRLSGSEPFAAVMSTASTAPVIASKPVASTIASTSDDSPAVSIGLGHGPQRLRAQVDQSHVCGALNVSSSRCSGASLLADRIPGGAQRVNGPGIHGRTDRARKVRRFVVGQVGHQVGVDVEDLEQFASYRPARIGPGVRPVWP